MIASAVNTSGFLQTALSELVRTELSATTQLRLRSTSDRVLTLIVHLPKTWIDLNSSMSDSPLWLLKNSKSQKTSTNLGIENV
jgi:hypothetical protein